MGDQLLRRIHLERRAGDEQARAESQRPDPGKRLERVVIHLARRPIHRVRSRRHEQRVAVGLRACRRLRADDGFGARAVIHHHLAAQALRKVLGEVARQDVVAAAGRERHDEPHRPRRISRGGIVGRTTLRRMADACRHKQHSGTHCKN